MKISNKYLKIASILSVVIGLPFLLILNSIALPNYSQNVVLGFLIGFSMIRLFDLSIGFSPNGFSKTAFQKQSENIVNWIKINVKSDMTPYQGKPLVEIAGIVIMIITGLGLTTLAPFISLDLDVYTGKNLRVNTS